MEIGLILPMGDDDRPGVPASAASILAMARAGQDARLDSLWVYDHLITVEDEGRTSGLWEAWTLLSALAVTTERVRLGTLVSCTGFRNPALLAKMAHTVQELSGGRLILGLGAGWHRPEYTAFGYPFDHRVDRFTEAIEIIVRLLRGEKTTYSGRYSQVDGCELLPTLSAGSTRTPILVGTAGERMMRLTARWADAWNVAWFGTPNERFTQLRGTLHAACDAEGRDPSTVDVTVGLVVGGRERPGRVPVEPAAVADVLHMWRAEGVRHVIAWPDPTDAVGVEAFLGGAAAYRAATTAAP